VSATDTEARVAGQPQAPTPYALAARELLRNTLLDAMGERLQSKAWAAVTMAEVARAAGVSRQTLYNEFGSRQEFAQAFVLREVDRFLLAVEQAITTRIDDPPAAVAAAFAVFLTAAAENPMVRSIVAGEGGGELLPLVTTHGEPVLERATERLSTVFLSAFSSVAAGDARLLADVVVRLAISYAALPSGSSELTAEAVARLLGPYVQSVLGLARD
jgi:AcrR family transcriptional regulator